MDSLLQLCTVALVATVAWPVCWLCGASPQWLSWHFHFIVWAWVMLGGFALAVAGGEMAQRKLAEWALLTPLQSPLVWFGLLAWVIIAIGAAVWLLAPERQLRREIERRGTSALLDHGRAGVDP